MNLAAIGKSLVRLLDARARRIISVFLVIGSIPNKKQSGFFRGFSRERMEESHL